MDSENRQRQIDRHLQAIRTLEAEAATAPTTPSWPPSGFYFTWHLGAGMIFGALGAMVSLIANALAAPLFDQRALELIRVFLTFPMGARALEVDAGTVLTAGCVLYLATGALYGVLIHLLLTVYFDRASNGRRLLVATAIGIGLWILNFYLILSWLQPLLLGGDWIVRLIPPWVGAATHIAFAWTVALAENLGWGRFSAHHESGSATPDGVSSHDH